MLPRTHFVSVQICLVTILTGLNYKAAIIGSNLESLMIVCPPGVVAPAVHETIQPSILFFSSSLGCAVSQNLVDWLGLIARSRTRHSGQRCTTA